MAKVLERMLTNHEALSSNPNMTKNKKKVEMLKILINI
jgi:hypothetical protein